MSSTPRTLKLDWLTPGKRQFDALETLHQKRVLDNIQRFIQHGTGDVTKMKGSVNPVEWRLKFKPWRVIFSIDGNGTLWVHSVEQRKDAYR